MQVLPFSRVPEHLQSEPDPRSAGLHRIVDSRGHVWAQCIPVASAARVFAAGPRLLENFAEMKLQLCENFWRMWDFGSSVSGLAEVADDDKGEFEADFPGAPLYARWLLRLDDVMQSAIDDADEWPVDSSEGTQIELDLHP